MRNVILAKTAGFCFGVRRAVDMAYGLAGKHKVYTYGPIIHNETVVDDLEIKGSKSRFIPLMKQPAFAEER